MNRLQVSMALAAMTFTPICAGGQEIPAPLSVAHRIEMKAGSPAAVLELQNLTDRPVAAYAVRLVKRGENGKVVSVRTHAVSTRGLGVSLGRPSFQTGERWTETLALPEGPPVEVELDLVLFEDGSFWGPNKSRQLERFQGLRDGARLEREAAAREK